MAGDYSRFRHQPKKRFSRVLEQQGRVRLDSEANELMEIVARRMETTHLDVFGECAASRATTPNAFLVGYLPGPPADLSLGTGRYYVDGLVAEIFSDETFTYRNQPFLSFDANGAPTGAVPPALGDFTASVLAYIDVFEREVTYIEDPSLLEVALGGPDTTTRSQTVWQVKLLGGTANSPVSCATDLHAAFPPSGGRLSSHGVQPPAPTDPCTLPDSPGFRGVENRLYRVEIHNGGDLTTARFKWSHDNASIVSRVEAIATAAVSTLTVSRIGRDSVLRFKANDWVEIIDDRLELWAQPGFMARVATTNESTRTLVLDRPITANLFDPTNLDRHTRIRRWDQVTDVDANGLRSIVSGWMPIEDGVEIQLTLPSGGSFHVGDYWVFAARSVDASVETLTDAPPQAIIHHYCPLATFTSTASTAPSPQDCRTLWPPLATGGDNCECTRCVTPESHADGSMNIQRAIDEVRELGGGKVCLDVGEYPITTALNLDDARNVTLRGRASTIQYSGTGAAVTASNAYTLRFESLAIQSAGSGFHLENCIDVDLSECVVVVPTRPTQNIGRGVELAGFIYDMTISECYFTAAVGIGLADAEVSVLVTLDLKITDNFFTVSEAGISLGTNFIEQQLTLTSHVRMQIARNAIGESPAFAAINVAGIDIPGSSVDVEENYVASVGFGIVAGAAEIGVRHNAIHAATSASQRTQGAPAGVWVAAFDNATARITSNVITSANGHGIVLAGALGDVAVAENAILEAGLSGIITDNASITAIDVSRNQLQEIGGASRARPRGIGLALVESVQVAENLIRNVATRESSQAHSCAAIDLVGCRSMIVTANRISGVGPSARRGIPAAGIEVLGAAQDATISDNVVQHVEDTTTVDGIALFTAIRMRPSSETNDTTTPSNNSVVYFTGETQVRFSRRRAIVFSDLSIAFLDARTASAGVHGNTCYGVDSVSPVIDLEVTGPLTVTHNRVDQASSTAPTAGGPSASASLRAVSPAVSAGQNIVRTEVTPAISLEGLKYTALGNMVSTEIYHGGVPIPAPWDALNERGI